MRFDGGRDAALRRSAITASLEYRLAADWTITAGGGVNPAGDVVIDAARYDIGVGALGHAGVAYRVLDGDGWEPFLLLGASFAASTAPTDGPIDADLRDQAQMTAVDARVSLILGESVADALAPYLALRGFGGPISWTYRGQDLTGSDKRHFQLGGGLVVTAGWLDAYLEIVPLGERTALMGAALSW